MRIILFILLLLTVTSTFAQDAVPILRTNVSVLDIRDGDLILKEYWHIDPELKPDAYIANKSGSSKTVSFYSDIDSISFLVNPGDSHDFLVVYGETDTCHTQIKSGMLTLNAERIERKQDTVPFTLTDANNIIIEAILNDADTLQMMFHTAQASVALTREAIARIESDRFDHSIESESWGGKGNAEYSLGNELQIQGLSWSELTIWSDKHTGPTADGKFGINLFPEKVIELNFDINHMVIHSRLPDDLDGYEKLDLHFQNEMMFLDVAFQIDKIDYAHKVLLHSGFAGTLLLNEAFVEEHQLRAALPISTGRQLRDAHGNNVNTEKATLPTFSLGSQGFRELPVGFFAGKIGGESRSVMGGDLIKRFNMFIDLQNAFLYLRPSDLLDEPFGDRT